MRAPLVLLLAASFGCVVSACGGKLQPLEPGDPPEEPPVQSHPVTRPGDPGGSTPSSPGIDDPRPPGSVSTHPGAPQSPGGPREQLPPNEPPPVPSPEPPQPPPVSPSPRSPSPEELGLPPTVVACAPGESVEMSFQIPAEEMAQGDGDRSGVGYCTGVVKFQEETFDGSYWDTSSSPWKRVSAVANGRSYNPNPTRIPGHVHTSTLVYADGRSEPQYCSFWAMCEGGIAKGVWFTW